MKIECTDNRTFRLTQDDQHLGDLVYKSLFSYQAEISLTDARHFELKSADFFGTSIAVTKQEAEVANLRMNWKGQIVMSFQDNQEFIFKSKGVFHNKYVIEDKDKQELIRFDPTFNWGKFTYNYAISFDTKPEDVLFVLLGVYAANYYIAAVAGAA